MKRSWRIWIDEFKDLTSRQREGLELSSTENSHLQYLKNLLEAGLGTKTTIGMDCRRNQLRVPCNFKAHISQPFSSDAVVENFSEGGLMLAIDTGPPENGSSIKLNILMGNEIDSYDFNAVVRWGSAPPDVKIGVEFMELPGNISSGLMKHFFTILEETIKINVDKE